MSSDRKLLGAEMQWFSGFSDICYGVLFLYVLFENPKSLGRCCMFKLKILVVSKSVHIARVVRLFNIRAAYRF